MAGGCLVLAEMCSTETYSNSIALLSIETACLAADRVFSSHRHAAQVSMILCWPDRAKQATRERLTFCMTTAPLVPELLAMSRNGEPSALLQAAAPCQPGVSKIDHMCACGMLGQHSSSGVQPAASKLTAQLLCSYGCSCDSACP